MARLSVPSGTFKKRETRVEEAPSCEGLAVMCPACENHNVLTPELTSCVACGSTFGNRSGIIDLVRNPDLKEEREFYDTTYSDARPKSQVPIDWEMLEKHWTRPDFPERQIVLEKLGDLKGKSVLLLGNGGSDKELLFIRHEPKCIVYSDLSIEALLSMRDRYELDQGEKILRYVSVDAQEIQFAPSSFDIVYGYAMVHHLPNLPKFFASVERVLKPGGRAVFMDDAYAPVWHYAKQTLLRPLMRYSHAKTGISPEDLRFSLTGGFKEAELAHQIEAVGCTPWFERTSFLAYVIPRGIEKLAPAWMMNKLRSSGFGRLLVRADAALGRFEYFRRNQIRLVWGLSKPN